MTNDSEVSLADRVLYAIPAGTTIPTADAVYTSDLWANKYGLVRTGTTKGAEVTIEFSGEAKEFILIVDSGTTNKGATYIDHIDVYY